MPKSYLASNFSQKRWYSAGVLELITVKPVFRHVVLFQAFNSLARVFLDHKFIKRVVDLSQNVATKLVRKKCWAFSTALLYSIYLAVVDPFLQRFKVWYCCRGQAFSQDLMDLNIPGIVSNIGEDDIKQIRAAALYG